ncbi:MAG: hypothetical protein QOI87_1917 [Bradyrhizobium sp.]|jgi:hypothetical protein|nr:hypothetical protein [Bradyrhizobium sp.]
MAVTRKLLKIMDRQAFGRAREEAGKAAQKIAEIREAKTLREIADIWSGFLTDIQRSYTKLRIACRSGSNKGWCDDVFHTRNADELLSYVLHVRNADEHGVAKITDETQGGIGLQPKQGNFLDVDHLEVGPKGIVMGPGLAASARITFTPGQVLLVPVRDRGIVYDVPKRHLGEDLGSATLVEVAERAEGFLRGKLGEADSRF